MTAQKKVVELARSYINKVKYVFGADDMAGGRADCSSFTRYIYKQMGYDIPRTTGGVWTSNLPEISRYDLQEGDLILFKNTWDSGYKDGVSHIGIYSGNGKVIHNSSYAGTVVESKLSDMSSEYLGAKRVIGASDYTPTVSIENISTNKSTKSEAIGLEWWGDIVKVVLVTLLFIGGALFSILAIKEVATNA